MSTDPTNPRLIAIDWGTTSFRAWLMGDGGAVLAEVPSGPGILAVAPGGFEAALHAAIGPWLTAHPDVPVIASGMITSRNGWVETAYLPLPCGPADLAAAVVRHPIADRTIHFVTGVLRDGPLPDVMRGEETEIAGQLAAADQSQGLFILPGTHSKWATVEGGRLTAFQTVMTGEVFALLRDQSILGRLAEAGSDDEAFRRGLKATGGALLGRVFSARTLALTGQLAPTAVGDYLSGLLIGDEVAAGLANHDGGPITVIGRGDLAQRYHTALTEAGANARLAAPGMARAGLWTIATLAEVIR